MMQVDTQLKLRPWARRSSLWAPVYAQLDDYQKKAVDFAIEVETAALLCEQGTGKTWICGGIIEHLMSPSFTGCLVVLLANLESTWVKFLRRHIPQLTICHTWEAFKLAPSPKLFLVNYEGMRKKRLIEKVRKHQFTFIGYDESQRLRNRANLDSRIAAKLRTSSRYRVILTGTPLDENPAELWAQYRFLDHTLFGTRWKDFADYYLEPIDPDLEKRFGQARPNSFRFHKLMREMRIAEGNREFDFDKFDEFVATIEDCSLRVTKEVLNLPPAFVHEVPITLRGEQRRVYRSLARDMLTTLGRHGAQLTAPMRITQIGRLQQVCGGYVPDDDGEVHEVGRAKLRKTLAIIAREKKPIVVFCRFLEEVWSLHDELIHRGMTIRTLTGRDKKQRTQLLEEFQAGEIDVLICQVKTGGVGVDLFRASVGIFYSTTYSHIDFEQAVARLHRRGQQFDVHLYLLFARDTIDEDIYAAILSKRKITRKVLTRLEHERSHRYGQGSEEEHQVQAGSRRAGIQVRRRRSGQVARPRAGQRSREAA